MNWNCSLCGKMFTRRYNLQRHIDNIHGGEGSEKENEESDSVNEHSESDMEGEEPTLESSENEDSDSDLEDNTMYQLWLQQSKETVHEMWNMKYEKYINQGMSESDAKAKANDKTLWAVKKEFFNKYKGFLVSHLHLKDNETHQGLIDSLEEKVDNGASVNRAVNRVMPKYHAQFEGLFQQDEDDNDDEEEDSDT